jgi:homospermidine synthase
VPEFKYLGSREGEKSYVVIPKRAHKTWIKTWIPGFGEVIGTVPHHEETITMAEYVSIRDKEGNLLYQPTVYFCYRPMDAALESLQEFAERNYLLQKSQLVINDDIVTGGDYLGVLILGHDFKGWWVGSLLDIHTTRQLAPHNSATSLQGHFFFLLSKD